MADYLAGEGRPARRMMRQTAAFQMALDLDDEPWLRWRVLNAAAPYVVAIFANSPVYDGEETGCRSTRAQVWRALDPARTGLPWDGRDPVGAYLDFALDGPGDPVAGGRTASTGASASGWAAPTLTLDEWHDHLTTLFPEVRPRGHFELRSARRAWRRSGTRRRSRWRWGSPTIPAPCAPPPTCSARPTRACSSARAAWASATRSSARVAAELVQIALDGCADLGPAISTPPIWSRRGRSSTATPAGAGARPTTPWKPFAPRRPQPTKLRSGSSPQALHTTRT